LGLLGEKNLEEFSKNFVKKSTFVQDKVAESNLPPNQLLILTVLYFGSSLRGTVEKTELFDRQTNWHG